MGRAGAAIDDPVSLFAGCLFSSAHVPAHEMSHISEAQASTQQGTSISHKRIERRTLGVAATAAGAQR
jgi:hypothetical protein